MPFTSVARWCFLSVVASLVGCSSQDPSEPRTPVASAAPTTSAPSVDVATCRLARGEGTVLTAEERDKLAAIATATDTTGLVVVERGVITLEAGDATKPVETMSVTKSIVSLVMGLAIHDGKLALDQSASAFLPAWKGTPKEAITVAHLLEQTSGLADEQTTEKIYASTDFVAFAAESELTSPPGKMFRYSNRTANLLPHIAAAATGEGFESFAKSRLFDPLGVRDAAWSRDRAGNVQGMSGLSMSARSLATIGEMMLGKGALCGKHVVPAEWIATSTAYSPAGFSPVGLLWWLTPESTEIGFSAKLFEDWKASGVPEDFIAKFRPYEGRYWKAKERPGLFGAVKEAMKIAPDAPESAMEPWYAMTWKAGRPDGAVKQGPLRAIVGDGYGGQALLIYPAKGVVIARLRDLSGGLPAKEEVNFQKWVSAMLFPEPAK